jgi:glyoxylase-like metal-dependent hydrolase (beta-lactamase superfamily II)
MPSETLNAESFSMPLEDEFSDIIKKARMGHGLSTGRVAAEAGLAESAVGELERGRGPTHAEVRGIAGALRLRAEALEQIAIGGWNPAPVPDIRGVETIVGDIGGYAVKGYVVYDEASRDAVIVDTGYHAAAMLDVVDRLHLRLTAACLTHGHTDHAGELDRILARWPVPVYLGTEDEDLLDWHPPARLLTLIADKDDGTMLPVGQLKLHIIRTPGHTPGGLCYRVHGTSVPVCFVGDTLFAGSVGRANPFSLYPTHLRSVRERVLTLPADAILLPGHGPATTVREEQRHNPFGPA